MDVIQRELNLRFLALSYLPSAQQHQFPLIFTANQTPKEETKICDLSAKDICDQTMNNNPATYGSNVEGNVENCSPVDHQQSRRSRNKRKSSGSNRKSMNSLNNKSPTQLPQSTVQSIDNILNNSFPDFNSNAQGDYQYHTNILLPKIQNFSLNNIGNMLSIGHTNFTNDNFVDSLSFSTDVDTHSFTTKRRKQFVIKPNPKFIGSIDSDKCLKKNPSMLWGRAHWAIANSIFCGVSAPKDGVSYPVFKMSIYNQCFNSPFALVEQQSLLPDKAMCRKDKPHKSAQNQKPSKRSNINDLISPIVPSKFNIESYKNFLSLQMLARQSTQIPASLTKRLPPKRTDVINSDFLNSDVSFHESDTKEDIQMQTTSSHVTNSDIFYEQPAKRRIT